MSYQHSGHPPNWFGDNFCRRYLLEVDHFLGGSMYLGQYRLLGNQVIGHQIWCKHVGALHFLKHL